MGTLNTLRGIISHPLNTHDRLPSLGRWLKWQVGSRLVPGPVAVEFANNALLLARPGMTGASGNIYSGLHEFEDMAFAMHLLRDGDGFVDVGANIGSYTVLASAAIGAQTLSIEPIPSTFQYLLRNICLNDIKDRVTPLNMGIGAQDGVLKFTSGLDTVNHVIDDRSTALVEHVEVRVTTLDKAVGALSPRLIKIDVEGFEHNVVAGASEVLLRDSLHAVIMELNGSGNRYGFGEGIVHNRMNDYGFDAFTYSPFERRLSRHEGISVQSGNMLYIRNLDIVEQILFSAPPFTVKGLSI